MRTRKCLKTRPKVTARGELRRTVVETQNSAESLPATNETPGRLLLVMSENCVVTPDGCLRGTVVVIQHATDPLATANRSWADCSIKRLNQLVTDTLMVPLGIVVGDEFGYRATKMPLP